MADPDGTPTYAEYVARGGGDIVEADWPLYLARANRVVRSVTQGRDLTVAETLEEVTDALCQVADALHSQSTGVVSERLGAYSVTYGPSAAPAARTAHQVARAALAGTGLVYSGMSTGLSALGWQDRDVDFDDA